MQIRNLGTDPDVLNDRYELGDVIGRGGTADVYSATDQVLGREVAVKVLRASSATETDRQRFVSEARTLAALDHPNLLSALDAGMDGDELYLVMPLIGGESLGDRPSGPLPLGRVAAVGEQIANALAYAHEQGVIHRDVKPGNLLVGEEGHIWLADFGVSRVVGQTVRYTETGKIIGTAAYLAPEQVQGTAVTPAADVYSLGLVLRELITGELTYPGPPVEAALARLTTSPPLPPDLPKRWRHLLQKMTALEPGERCSAIDCAAELRDLASDADSRRALAPEDRSTALMDAPYADADRRRRSRFATAAGALLVLIVSGIVLIGRNGDPDRQQDRFPSDPAAAHLPAGVPPALREPLQALHDAVQAAPADRLPSLAVTLRRVDGAVVRHEYPQARARLAELVQTVEVARANQLVEKPVAERLLAAAAGLRAALLAAAPRATSTTGTVSPTTPPSTGGDDRSGRGQQNKPDDKLRPPGKGRGRS